MAERTGNSELDTLIAQFLTSEYQDASGELWPVDSLSEPDMASNNCFEVSDQFVDFLNQHLDGYHAWISGDIARSEGWALNTPDAFGYHDRSIPGFLSHHWVIVEHDGETWGLDFTAAQYGYRELPLVQRLDENGCWQREWTPRPELASGTAGEPIERERAESAHREQEREVGFDG